MKRPAVRVSDHAVIRYLERVQGLDVDGLRDQVGHLVATGVEHGACGVNVDGYVYRIRGGVVTTVLHAHRADPRTGGHRGRRGDAGRGDHEG